MANQKEDFMDVVQFFLVCFDIRTVQRRNCEWRGFFSYLSRHLLFSLSRAKVHFNEGNDLVHSTVGKLLNEQDTQFNRQGTEILNYFSTASAQDMRIMKLICIILQS